MRNINLLITIIAILSSNIVLAGPSDNTLGIVEGSGVITASSILQILLSLILVIFIIILASWVYKKYGNISSPLNDKFKVITGISLGPKEKIVLLQVGDEQILVGITPGMIRNIHTLSECLEINDNNTNLDDKVSFLERFNSELLKFKRS